MTLLEFDRLMYFNKI